MKIKDKLSSPVISTTLKGKKMISNTELKEIENSLTSESLLFVYTGVEVTPTMTISGVDAIIEFVNQISYYTNYSPKELSFEVKEEFQIIITDDSDSAISFNFMPSTQMLLGSVKDLS